MTKKLLAVPAMPKPKHSPQSVEEHSHIVLSIGGERFALDICGTLTERDTTAFDILGAAVGHLQRRESQSDLAILIGLRELADRLRSRWNDDLPVSLVVVLDHRNHGCFDCAAHRGLKPRHKSATGRQEGCR